MINHGSDAFTREAVSMPVFYWLSRWFVERGYVVVLPQRRGHGATGGDLAEGRDTCADPDHLGSGQAAADDIEAALGFMERQPFVDPSRLVVAGVSTGGWAALGFGGPQPTGIAVGRQFCRGPRWPCLWSPQCRLRTGPFDCGDGGAWPRSARAHLAGPTPRTTVSSARSWPRRWRAPGRRLAVAPSSTCYRPMARRADGKLLTIGGAGRCGGRHGEGAGATQTGMLAGPCATGVEVNCAAAPARWLVAGEPCVAAGWGKPRAACSSPASGLLRLAASLAHDRTAGSGARQWHQQRLPVGLAHGQQAQVEGRRMPTLTRVAARRTPGGRRRVIARAPARGFGAAAGRKQERGGAP